MALVCMSWSNFSRVGGEAEWLTPTGAPRTARILALDFQPEAAGQYTT